MNWDFLLIDYYNCKLFCDLYSFPERDMILDIVGGIFGTRIKPGGILVLLAVYFNVVIGSLSFPGTGRVMIG